MKAYARAVGRDIIDFGMGNPDQPPALHIIEKLQDTVLDTKIHLYSNSHGILGLREAQSDYYIGRFSVDVDPETETIITLGLKEGLANLSSVIMTFGDIILVQNPSYTFHPFGFIIASAAVRNVAVAQGIGFCEKGDCQVKIILVEDVQRIRQAIRNIKIFLNTKVKDVLPEVQL